MRTQGLLFILLLSVISACGSSKGGAKNDGPTIVYLVRHCEKELTGGDVELSEVGVERAEELSNVLSNKSIQYIHSTKFKRTMNTAKPTSEHFKLETKIYDHLDLPGLVNEIKSKGGVHLVVGHSNTTPAVAELLGGDSGTKIDEKSEYDRLYVVSLSASGEVSSEIQRYGKPYQVKE